MNHLFMVLIWFAAIAVVVPGSAVAQTYGCNPNSLGPGERHVGFAPGGPGVAPTPLCVQDAVPQAPRAGTPSRPDRMAGMLAQALDANRKVRQVIEESGLALTKEQRAAREARGYWTYSYFPGIAPKATDNCWARFNIRKQGEMTVGVIGPEPKTNHVFLFFVAAGIPQVTDPKGAQLSWTDFQQNNDPAIRRRMQHVSSPGEADASLLAVGVPKLGDVVKHIDEGHRFRIQMGGAEVFDVSVHSVDEMKRRMVECEAMVQAARATGR